ncbi:MAG: hypothetical protein IPH51_09290 [Rubrivivax sp.]|nr:hypothetical protein [Rubrivivax sp.]
MALLTLTNAHLAYGHVPLLDGADFARGSTSDAPIKHPSSNQVIDSQRSFGGGGIHGCDSIKQIAEVCLGPSHQAPVKQKSLSNQSPAVVRRVAAAAPSSIHAQ